MDNKSLERLIEKAKSVKMSEEDKRRQRVSSAYGNLKFECPDLKRETIEQLDEKPFPRTIK